MIFSIFQNRLSTLKSPIFGRVLFSRLCGNKIEILLPPHTPPMKISTVLVVWLLSWNLANAQSGRSAVQLLPIEIYQKSLKVYYNKLWTAERKEFQDLNIKSVLYYFPSVGLQFGLPSVQFSLTSILNYKRDKKVNKSKLSSLDLKLELELNERLQELKTAYVALEYESDKIKAFKRSYSSMKGIWAVQMECCTKNQCTPLDCRKIEFESLQWEEQERIKNADFVLKILELEKLAKFDLPSEKIYFNKSECILESEEFKLLKNR